MYGKHFATMYTGSMIGAGAHVFAVWGYAISNANRLGSVELNPVLISYLIGMPPEQVEAAVAYLCAPDARSRTPDEDGRRLVHEGGILYTVVNATRYRGIRDEEMRREYFRVKKQESRARKKAAWQDGD